METISLIISIAVLVGFFMIVRRLGSIVHLLKFNNNVTAQINKTNEDILEQLKIQGIDQKQLLEELVDKES